MLGGGGGGKSIPGAMQMKLTKFRLSASPLRCKSSLKISYLDGFLKELRDRVNITLNMVIYRLFKFTVRKSSLCGSWFWAYLTEDLYGCYTSYNKDYSQMLNIWVK